MRMTSNPSLNYNTHIPEAIMTQDTVETSIGTLNFFDGVPSKETADRVYDHLDTMRSVDTFMKGMRGASLKGLINGVHSLGAVEANEVMIFDELMDVQFLFLTANSSILYAIPDLNLKRDGPIVVEVLAGLLGAANDAWFRFINNLSVGGKYLYLPPGYDGPVPDGFAVHRPKTYQIWFFLRSSVKDGEVEKTAALVTDNVKVYPLSQFTNPSEMKWASASGKAFNTIHPNNSKFYYQLNEIVQYEPLEMNIKGVRVYQDTNSLWLMGYTGGNAFFNGEDGITMNTDARVMFHYPYTAVIPAMAVPRGGKGSDYDIAYVDADKNPFDGAKTYKLHIPANLPVANFCAVTVYDPQARSMLKISQKYPNIGDHTKGIRQNDDGSYTIYFSPEAPKDTRTIESKRFPARAGLSSFACTARSGRGSIKLGGPVRSN